jgi:hypothetical protein
MHRRARDTSDRQVLPAAVRTWPRFARDNALTGTTHSRVPGSATTRSIGVRSQGLGRPRREEAAVFALFLEAAADESDIEWAREELPGEAVPRMRQLGAVSGVWLAPLNGRGVAMVVFATAEEAQRAAETFHVGDQAGPVPEVAVRTVEVREVLASL